MPASQIRCSGCGRAAAPREPYPFRCPAAGNDDVDHIMVRVLDPARVRFPGRAEDADADPFVRYRGLLHPYHLALDGGMTDAGYRELVGGLERAVTRVDGQGFGVTPFGRSAELSERLGFAPDGGVWVKDETGNVSGSHKGRHLMGILLHLEVIERIGLAPPGPRPALAIASCGNAALAAAIVARAGDRELRVFVPEDGEPGVPERLEALGADVVACPRPPGSSGDPTYHALHQAIAAGALPFTCQGNENGLAIEGGLTLAYELVSALPGAGPAASARAASPAGPAPGYDHLVVQVGGGALASACFQGLREAVELGALARLPRLHTVQTFGAYPLERAYRRVVAQLPGAPQPPVATPGAPGGPTRDEVAEALSVAAGRRSGFMWPWEEEPKSVARGILDDETYDWRAVVSGMLETGGRPLVVREDLLVDANHVGTETTGIPVDPTGSAGLAGVLALREEGAVGDHERVVVLFTGVRR